MRSATVFSLLLSGCTAAHHIGDSGIDGGAPDGADASTNDCPMLQPPMPDASPMLDGGPIGSCSPINTSGTPITLADQQRCPGQITVDDINVYWVANGCNPGATGSVMKLAKAGGTPTVVADGLPSETLLAAGGGKLYWVNRATQANQYQDGSIWAAPAAGGTPTPLVQGLISPTVIAADGAGVYWADGSVNGGDALVERMNSDGTGLMTLAAGVFPLRMVTYGDYLYWTNVRYGEIMVVPTGGGSRETLTVTGEIGDGLAVDPLYVFFISPGDTDSSAVYTIDRFARCATGSLIVGSPSANKLVIDDEHVYWASFGGDIVGACKSGGPATLLATGLGPLTGNIAIDGTFLYWTTDELLGRVMKIAK